MIALTSVVAKLYHQIMAERMTDYLVRANIIDSTTQKAFLRGINGCIEHTQCMQEILAYARNRSRTVHVTFFDLTDAFGSVEHDLIFNIMQRNGIPPNIFEYVRNLYGKMQGSIQGPKWQSALDQFKCGVF